MNDLICWHSKFKLCAYSEKLMKKITLLNKGNYVDLHLVKKAIYYAKKYHGEQKRETGEPYYSHPLAVADMVSDYLFNTDVLVTCILHDIIEDTIMTKKMIEDIFGHLIASNVEKLTRIKFNGKFSAAEIVKSLWLAQEYELLIIKQMDRLHNMQSIFIKKPIKIKQIVSETVEIFLILSVYLELNDVELQLTKLCTKFLPKLSTCDEFNHFLTYGENASLLSPIFQSEATHSRNLCSMEKI